ncbi:hypothetical protein [Streptomyces sp. NPDC059072]|uniref:hypothetical protein n=1 Tax=Streptomyces sp. NPDC059072 TaxID=3346715 RepID=UPI0036CE578F
MFEDACVELDSLTPYGVHEGPLAPALEVVTSGEERGDPGRRRLVDRGGGLFLGDCGEPEPERSPRALPMGVSGC